MPSLVKGGNAYDEYMRMHEQQFLKGRGSAIKGIGQRQNGKGLGFWLSADLTECYLSVCLPASRGATPFCNCISAHSQGWHLPVSLFTARDAFVQLLASRDAIYLSTCQHPRAQFICKPCDLHPRVAFTCRFVYIPGRHSPHKALLWPKLSLSGSASSQSWLFQDDLYNRGHNFNLKRNLLSDKHNPP